MAEHGHNMWEEEPSKGRDSLDSDSSASTTSLVFDQISERVAAESGTTKGKRMRYGHDEADLGARLSELDDEDPLKDEASGDYDLETGPFLGGHGHNSNHDGLSAASGSAGKTQGGYRMMDRGLRRVLIIASLVFVTAWVGGLFIYISHKSYLHGSEFEHDPQATVSRGSLRKITREQVDNGFWRPVKASIAWVAGPAGEDGLLLETNASGASDKAYLTVQDVRSLQQGLDASTEAAVAAARRTLVEKSTFTFAGKTYRIGSSKASKDMSKVLLGVDVQSNWRHSSTAAYFILEVATQTVQPLIPGEVSARVQLAQWSPQSDAIAFTRDNNLYFRQVVAGSSSSAEDADSVIKQITTDGGPELFYGVPDWVYEEEVLGGASATWWSPDGRYIAFLRTNETGVPEYPVQYFLHRPSGAAPAEGEENYPEVRQIKYPKAGAHNPVVDLQFFDVGRGDSFSVAVSGEFADENRLITTVLWAGAQKVLVKETNRVSTVMRVVVVDVAARSGQAVRTVDVGAIDGGWFEISQRTRFIPADPARQRPDDGYIDTIVHNNGDHLAYFSPPENPEPIMLTAGPDWEVDDAPAAVDLERNLVYFLATIQGITQRHLYSVRLLDGGGLSPLTNTSEPGFYGASFSAGVGAGYVLLEYGGPNIPWQKVMNTPAAAAAAAAGSADVSKQMPFVHVLEDNHELAERARQYALPLLVRGTFDVKGHDEGVGAGKLNYLERRPPHFDPSKKYPVLFQQYSGPGSQEVTHEFSVDFQSYVAASLGYVVVTVDPRGTGFAGRSNRVVVRGRLGVVESHDHIAAAQHWASLPYIDGDRLAIWGWSYGGFTTLKTLEQDAGRTFRYGIAVAPVTDWRFYDSVYTERYMDTPQANAVGYDTGAVTNASALAQNVRFLIMHGIADDNVHLQNSLALLDRLDIEGVSNYDVHVFPDSDHSIYFHNGRQIVYDKLENWLINAFNGEWLKIDNAKPQGKR
ncbi:pheromone maturation dipeptidyl aminopeptidase [Grosmannia clavigera kw1407]|uniref:Probable dipeptidyl-aminopeptidase B n=1 Tax=Grosmannia clavigera (strain kw1407 / UAMH 11150) TaxID=655863 RepID=DAPB_GROCL|nr:pheromone maturation dipeptidyl aminopeptidase [Grosmannia clavigera kw1407]F0XS04.1 RecName: Full=Probable dipeptidyl-aminopeptidase B; Short=DPAP B [Grosmannia clavigera kw1407]EFW99394.1 pheromone maturation dipeptidyl aminopeptidase [Grosmannia clavigera kw1407]